MSSPIRFQLSFKEFHQSCNAARLAGEYAEMLLTISRTTLTLRTQGQGIDCQSTCSIDLKEGSLTEELCFALPRSPLIELAKPEAQWDHLDCSIDLAPSKSPVRRPKAESTQPTTDETTSSAEVVPKLTGRWTFKYGRTLAILPANLVTAPPLPPPLGGGQRFDAKLLARTLRALKPFTEPENKKNQFTSAFVDAGIAYAATTFRARLVESEKLPPWSVYIGSRQMSDLAYVLDRLDEASAWEAGAGSLLIFDGRSICQVTLGADCADPRSIFELTHWAAELPTLHAELSGLIEKIAGQVETPALVTVSVASTPKASLCLTVPVEGGIARLRHDLPEDVGAAPNVAVLSTDLRKLIAPSFGHEVRLQLQEKAVGATQVDDDVKVRTILSGMRKS